MRNRLFLPALSALVVTGLIAHAAPLHAQENTDGGEAQAGAEQSAPEVSASHLDAAREAIAAIGATDEFDNILLNAANQTKAEFIPNNPDRQNEISEMVDQKALELASRRAALETEIARIYAQTFSEEELNAISSFYDTAAGQKLLENGPALTRNALGAANVWTNGILRDLRRASLEGMNEIYGTAGTAGTGEGEASSGETSQ